MYLKAIERSDVMEKKNKLESGIRQNFSDSLILMISVNMHNRYIL